MGILLSYAYICTCIRRHLKKTIPSSNITWSEMGQQNIQAEEVYRWYWPQKFCFKISVELVLYSMLFLLLDYDNLSFPISSSVVSSRIKFIVSVLTRIITLQFSIQDGRPTGQFNLEAKTKFSKGEGTRLNKSAQSPPHFEPLLLTHGEPVYF